MRDGLADAPAGRADGVVAQDIAEVLAASLPKGGGNGRSLPVVQ
jgi:hypothetical protein